MWFSKISISNNKYEKLFSTLQLKNMVLPSITGHLFSLHSFLETLADRKFYYKCIIILKTHRFSSGLSACFWEKASIKCRCFVGRLTHLKKALAIAVSTGRAQQLGKDAVKESDCSQKGCGCAGRAGGAVSSHSCAIIWLLVLAFFFAQCM